MNRAIIDVLNALLLPRSRAAWVALLIFWCSLSSALFLSLKFSSGLLIDFRKDTFVLSLVTAPLFSAVMLLAQHWEKTRTRLIQIASTDALTGLMNRRAFFDAVESSEDGAFLLIDVDRFKNINDQYGHSVGDAILVALADHLWRNLRSSDLRGRIGGEEFGVFLFGTDSLQLDTIGARICSGFVFYDDSVPTPIKVTVSIGASYSAMSPNILELYKRCDEALYQAKNSGRGKMNFWHPPHSSR